MAPEPSEFTEGDILYLDPSDDATRRRVPAAVDLSRGRGTDGAFDETPLTADVDYLREQHLRARYPTLSSGTGAVRVDRGKDGVSDIVRHTDAGDLDAGVYHDDVSPRGTRLAYEQQDTRQGCRL